MSNKIIRVIDRTDAERDTTCDVGSLGPLLYGWLSDHGIRELPATLTRAVMADDWPTAHQVADALSLDVSPVPGGIVGVFTLDALDTALAFDDDEVDDVLTDDELDVPAWFGAAALTPEWF